MTRTRLPRAFALILLCSASAASARGYDVTTAQARRENLLEYIAGRSDLSASEKAAWDKAVRLTFGGKALTDGTDEGVTVAKSVVSAAIFYGIDEEKASRAALEAYHDTYRWVPPPLAINYQILAFQGRKPKATARQLAFDFPRYFNEEIAPDLASWWDEMLAAKKIPALEVREVTRVLAETRALMRPMLRDKLWQGAELEARRAARRGEDPVARQLDGELDELGKEIARDFRGVGESAVTRDASKPFYERYRALALELGQKAKSRPAYDAERVVPPTAKPSPVPLPPPPVVAKPEQPKKPTAPVEPPPRPTVENQDAFKPQKPAAPKPQPAEPRQEVSPAPLPGDPLVAPYPGWQAHLDEVVTSWVGTPYLFGGTDRRGIDCSAFVRATFLEALSVELPRNSRAQWLLGREVQQSALRPGDMIFFDTLDRGRVTHVAVYLGEGKFAHASSSKGVTRAVLAERYYQRAYWGSKRILSP